MRIVLDGSGLQRLTVIAIALVALLPDGAAGQRAALYQQVSLSSAQNGAFASRFNDGYRLLNAADLARLELYDALRNADLSARSRDERLSQRIAGELFARPPRLPVTLTSGGQPFAQLVPEAVAMLNWAHAFRRQVYDVLAQNVPDAEKTGRMTELLGYYRSRPTLAITSRPKDVGTLNTQPGGTTFRRLHPAVNGQMWATQWLELALAEALLQAQGDQALAPIADRFRQMLAGSPSAAPYLMPLSTAIAPSLAARYPDAAAILDNLHLLQDYLADLMVTPDIPRSAHRREVMRTLQFFREDTTAAATYATWTGTGRTLGARNMGGPALPIAAVAEAPTVVRGMALPPAAGTIPLHAGVAGGSAQDTSALRAVLDRMLSDPVIRERVATDPALQRMLAQSGMRPATSASAGGMTGMQHGNMNMPSTPGGSAMPGMQHGDAPAPGSSTTSQLTEEERRIREEFVLLLLNDPTVESRIHADPRLHRLWSDPDVQRRLWELRATRTPRTP